MSRICAKVFQDINYGGQYRYITQDISNFNTQIGFNDRVSSIIVYRGNSYVQGDKIRFYEDTNSGGYIDLEPGYYPNIHVHPFSLGDRISSADILPWNAQPSITIKLMVRVYQDINYGGQFRDLLMSENNFEKIDFNDRVSSLRVYAGEDYSPGWVCDFYQHVNYAGAKLLPGQFVPGTYIPNIVSAPYSFNDVISSVKIYQI